MIVIFNKNTRDYYLVTGLAEEGSVKSLLSTKNGNAGGDFIIISSGERNHSNNGVITAGIGLNFFKKIGLILFLISLIPFSSVISTGYMHLLNER